MWLNGEWREARNPAEEFNKIAGATQKVGCGEHTDKGYVEVLKRSPKYEDYLMTDGKHYHLEVKKFTYWIKRGELSIVKDVARAEVPE